MRAIHLSTWKEVCGISTYTSHLVNSLNSKEVDSEIYPIKREEIQHLSLKEIRDFFRLFCEKAREFDIVHIQHEHAFFNGSYPLYKSIDIFSEMLSHLKENNSRVIVTFHADPIFVQKLDRNDIGELERSLRILSNAFQTWKWSTKISPFFGNASRFIAISHTTRSRLNLLESGFSAKSVHLVSHGVSSSLREIRESLTEIDCRSILNFSSDTKLLSIFGFISENKGYVTAISTLKYLPNNYKLVILGGTHPYEKKDGFLDKILELINNLELVDRVVITGYVDFETFKLYSKATDIFLAPYLPSSLLSASGAITWALSSGKPVIASRIPAFLELNQNKRCLLLVSPESPRELAWEILKLDENIVLKSKLVENSLEYAEENSWDNIAVATQDLYTKMLNT